MEYRRFADTIIVRMNRGEELLEQLEKVALAENVKLAEVSTLGATDDFTVGVYDLAEKRYHANSFQGAFEIASLTGTITVMDGKYYAHIHMVAGDDKGRAFGGHLNRAVISCTCEMVIRVIEGRVERTRDEEIGINLLDFKKQC